MQSVPKDRPPPPAEAPTEGGDTTPPRAKQDSDDGQASYQSESPSDPIYDEIFLSDVERAAKAEKRKATCPPAVGQEREPADKFPFFPQGTSRQAGQDDR